MAKRKGREVNSGSQENAPETQAPLNVEVKEPALRPAAESAAQAAEVERQSKLAELRADVANTTVSVEKPAAADIKKKEAEPSIGKKIAGKVGGGLAMGGAGLGAAFFGFLSVAFSKFKKIITGKGLKISFGGGGGGGGHAKPHKPSGGGGGGGHH